MRKEESLTQTCSTKILRFINGIFCQYLCSYSVGNKFIDMLMDKNASSAKLFLLIFILSVIKLIIDLMMAKAR